MHVCHMCYPYQKHFPAQPIYNISYSYILVYLVDNLLILVVGNLLLILLVDNLGIPPLVVIRVQCRQSSVDRQKNSPRLSQTPPPPPLLIPHSSLEHWQLPPSPIRLLLLLLIVLLLVLRTALAADNLSQQAGEQANDRCTRCLLLLYHTPRQNRGETRDCLRSRASSIAVYLRRVCMYNRRSRASSIDRIVVVVAVVVCDRCGLLLTNCARVRRCRRRDCLVS